MLNWYDQITTFVLDYISISIKDSAISNFYRYIISLKNLLRSTEYAGKAGVYGIRYLASGTLTKDQFQSLVQADVLRREYLNQSFNFMPELEDPYYESDYSERYDAFQAELIDNDVSSTVNIYESKPTSFRYNFDFILY